MCGVACCLRFVAVGCGLLYCAFVVVCVLLFAVWRSLLFAVNCVLPAVCSVLVVVCCLLFGVRCVLLGVCCVVCCVLDLVEIRCSLLVVVCRLAFSLIVVSWS